MDNLPQDPAMLFSFINMKLRDEYPSLDELCASFASTASFLKKSSTRPDGSITPKPTSFGNGCRQSVSKSSTGQWSAPWISLCMAAPSSLGNNRSDIRK